jgi:hypothetical protein
LQYSSNDQQTLLLQGYRYLIDPLPPLIQYNYRIK